MHGHGAGERLPPVQNGSPRAAGGSSVGQRASERVRQKRAGLAATVRAERDERLHKHLMKGSEPRVATVEEQNHVAMMLNDRMKVLFLDPQARSWYKLFCHMDDDLSGKVNFYELEDMVRNELKVSTAKLPDELLKSIWRALDEDSSGLITSGEFGHFMRRGIPLQNAEDSSKWKVFKKREAAGESTRQEHKELISAWREARNFAETAVMERTAQLRNEKVGRTVAAVARVKQHNVAVAQAVRHERDECLSRHLMNKGSDGGSTSRAATAQECEQFSILLNHRMAEIFLDPQARSWYKLFVHMDDDSSGKINYHELEDMVRNELKVQTSKFSDEQLRGIWQALDEDKSGLITAGEFGKFMRLGASVHDSAEKPAMRLAKAKKAEGATSRQEKEQLLTEKHQKLTVDEDAKRSRVAEQRDVAWGLRAPADTHAAWRSPNAVVF